MTSTIKVDDQLKRRFDQQQAKILLETGKKVSQQELMEHLLNQVESNEEDFLKDIQKIQLPFPTHNRKRMLGLQFDLGVDTSKEDEDKVIYRD
jgi:hypothetical protein